MPAMLAQERICHAAADAGGGPAPGDSSSHRGEPKRTGGAKPFFTIGHSTRPLDEFVALLREARVELLVDVRLFPRSRTNPQYNQDTLPQALGGYQIGYEHIAALGGRRGKSDVVPSVNAFWQHASFHNYADYAMSEAFHAAFERLRELGHTRTSAMMCAEAVWWRCHRRIIADYLLASGETVLHIMSPGHIVPAKMTEAAQRAEAGTLVYPAEQGSLL
jgi:uncharacterized protein (DUF488 family)